MSIKRFLSFAVDWLIDFQRGDNEYEKTALAVLLIIVSLFAVSCNKEAVSTFSAGRETGEYYTVENVSGTYFYSLFDTCGRLCLSKAALGSEVPRFNMLTDTLPEICETDNDGNRTSLLAVQRKFHPTALQI